jgi:hypothetical protein
VRRHCIEEDPVLTTLFLLGGFCYALGCLDKLVKDADVPLYDPPATTKAADPAPVRRKIILPDEVPGPVTATAHDEKFKKEIAAMFGDDWLKS